MLWSSKGAIRRKAGGLGGSYRIVGEGGVVGRSERDVNRRRLEAFTIGVGGFASSVLVKADDPDTRLFTNVSSDSLLWLRFFSLLCQNNSGVRPCEEKHGQHERRRKHENRVPFPIARGHPQILGYKQSQGTVFQSPHGLASKRRHR